MIFYHLGMHPAWQLRILEEVENNTSRPDSNIEPHSVSYSTLANCSSLNAVIKESLRVSPPFPSSFPRDIAPGAENAIPGLPAPLPLGTTVQANVYVIGHSREFWGDDADEWKPSRWFEGEGKRLEDGYFIFGRGHRACVGRGISYMALSKIVYAVSFSLLGIAIFSTPADLHFSFFFGFGGWAAHIQVGTDHSARNPERTQLFRDAVRAIIGGAQSTKKTG